MFLVEFSKYCDKRQREVGIRLTQLTANKYHRLLRYMTEYTREQYRKDDLPLDAIDYAYIDGLNTFMQTAHNCKNNGAVNLLCCLIAKKAGNGCQTIARVRNPEYSQEVRFIREELGMAMVINPELSTADEIMRVLVFPSAAKVEVFGKGKLELVEYRLPDFPWLENITLVELYKKIKTKFLICAVQRDEKVFIPSGDFALQEGDRIHVAASHRNIERFFRASGFMKDKVRTVMIVGGGRVGYYLSKQLLAVGMKVKLIEKDRERCEKLSDLLPKAIVICGDGTDQDLLIEEGVLEVDGFVALTGIDEENMIISLFAKDSTNAKVVTKVSRENYIDLSSELGLDCVVSFFEQRGYIVTEEQKQIGRAHV